MTAVDRALDWIGKWLAAYLLERPRVPVAHIPPELVRIRAALQPGDVVLIEGQAKISTAIKYLTQSTWSHAAIYVGERPELSAPGEEPRTLVEANLGEGVVAVALSKYANVSVRICRPVGLTAADRAKVVEVVLAHLGDQYDTRNLIDLARYLLPTPPVPARWRRRMIALGSGEPTRAICSTLIAHAFEAVRYPILPSIERVREQLCAECPEIEAEILHIRHHSLYAPRDFDLSPYFQVVKPALEAGFDYRRLVWADDAARADDAS